MNRGKCNWNCCCENNNNWGCGKSNSNHWGGCEQKNKCEDKKQYNNKFSCFCCECEKKQEENKHCGCEQNKFGKESSCGSMNSGFGYNDYGYGYDNFYTQGY